MFKVTCCIHICITTVHTYSDSVSLTTLQKFSLQLCIHISQNNFKHKKALYQWLHIVSAKVENNVSLV